MTATNHALTGAVIGLLIHNPVLAVASAFISHFICDALPHFGVGREAAGKRWFIYLLITEALACLVIVLTLFLIHPAAWPLAAICAFIATTPDFMWIKGFVQGQKGRPVMPFKRWPLRFHAWIQWFERPVGAVFELAWAFAAIILLKVLTA